MKTISVIIVGAGNRAKNYTYNMKEHGGFKVVGVADPIKAQRDYIREFFNIPDEMCFNSWEDILAKPKMADVAIISTSDKLHHAPALAAIEKGYDLLLEKPVAPTEQECADIANLAKEKGSRVLVCHVLRYTPFFMKIKQLINEGRLGKVLSVHHCECVGNLHQSHSYVRGNWGNSERSSNMLLAKSCHDIDIIQWLVGSKCKNVQSFGSLDYFTEKNAPADAPEYCIEGCPHGEECYYNAVKLYLEDEQNEWFRSTAALKPNPTNEEIEEVLRTKLYGKCVFKCDNDVVDHQVVNMEFENSAVASFNMSAFNHHGRFIRVMGTEGEIEGDIDSDTIKYFSFKTREHEIINPNKSQVDSSIVGGHGGGDKGIIETLYKYIVEGYDGDMLSEISISVQNHLIVFAAEKSRRESKVVNISEFEAEYLK